MHAFSRQTVSAVQKQQLNQGRLITDSTQCHCCLQFNDTCPSAQGLALLASPAAGAAPVTIGCRTLRGVCNLNTAGMGGTVKDVNAADYDIPVKDSTDIIVG
jgi:hypothetical protein